MKILNNIKQNKFREPLPNKKILGLIVVVVLIIFGVITLNIKKAENVPGWNWGLGDRVIVIDAGHGGVDPGAIGSNNTLEKDVTLEISKRLQSLFVQAGGKVIMIREEDRDFGQSDKLFQRKREDLIQRIEMATNSGGDIFLSIHANSFPDKKQSGPQVFYHAQSVEGKVLAESIQDTLNEVGSRKRTAKSNQSFFILKNTNQIAVTIEVGFLSNPEEEMKLTQPKYQQNIAMAIYEGTASYYNNK
ncbi:MAG: N-acetylmuramoyl-L-alanine amidase [Eubacteriales bacterium]